MNTYRHPLAVAPMMDWTDRYCRAFHRRLTRRALLYTEMIVADAVIHGDREQLLGLSEEEHPVAVQLGGSEPDKLRQAARIAEDYGYDEINLNVGCPSSRVRAGTFGACLMRQPQLVGDCISAIAGSVKVPVTVKCRIGVDDQDPETSLDELANAVIAAGANAIWVHARKAWLDGLSPKENRNVPPLDYDRVYRLKDGRSGVFVGINGGIASLGEVANHLKQVDGVMLGRAAYQTPALLADVDREIYGEAISSADLHEIVVEFLPQLERWFAQGVRLGKMVRPMLGLFHGAPGARQWRRILSVEASRPGAGTDVVEQALAVVARDRAAIASGIVGRRSEISAARNAVA